MRRAAVAAVILIASVPLLFADHVPVAPAGTVEARTRSALVVDGRSFDALLEIEGALGLDPIALGRRGVTVGGYWRPIDNLKLGAFYRLQAGLRHDDDWIDLAPGWGWQDTRGRWESQVLVDASPRFALPFLPGGDWVFMLKTRWQLNAFNGEQSLLVRPSLTWFWIRDREPVLNVALSWDLYAPLNFGTALLYEQYPYVTLLWHASPAIALEASAAYRTVTWSPSEDFHAAHPTETYTVPSRSFVVGAGVVVRLAAP
jgi:hypothetical protein